MDDDREAYEFSYALYLARQVDRDAAQMIARASGGFLVPGSWFLDYFK